MNHRPLRMGIVGCGWAGGQAVLAATAVPRTDVVAVSDLNEALRDLVAEKYAVSRQYGDYRQLLDDQAVEAVYLAVNPVMRHQMALDGFAAGKHVLVQKPHAVRAEQIPVIERAAAQAGKTLQFCYFMRHFPKNRRIRAAIQQGHIGAPYHARIFLKFNYQPATDGIERWLQVYGHKGGALGQHASHELDMAWWWMGCPKPAWAFAARHAVYPAYDGLEGPAEDYFSGLVGLEGGMTIQIDCSRWLHSDTPTTVELYGRDGAVTGGKISRYEDGVFTTEEADAPLDISYSQPPESVPAFYYEIERFAMAVEGLVEPEVNAQDAYQFMQILDALYDSAKTGDKVEIE